MRKKNRHSPSSALKSSTSMIKKESGVTLIKTARKSRSKTRKPKFLSLRLQISPGTTVEMPTDGGDCDRRHQNRRHQLDLFPLHPENLVEEKDNHDDNVAYFFSAEDGGATTLTGLLGADTSSSACDLDNNNAASLSPESLTYGYRRQDSEEVEQLVRTAMRNKAREESEEKWVSCCRTPVSMDIKEKKGNQRRRLSLKLDYQEIMDAWSDKGPLYLGSDSSPQVVPDLGGDDLFGHPSTNGWGSGGALWTVPEMSGSNSNGCIKLEEGHEEWKIGKREASVLRYKEKRRNRLFSKKIRYEVRKLNAEKRPRIKGRFVKRI